MKWALPIVLIASVILPGCGGSTTATTTQASAPPNIVAFEASPSNISAGQNATLIWNVTAASVVSIDQGIGQVALAGTRQVSPAKDTAYVITCTGAGGTVTKSVTIKVTTAPATPIAGATPTPTTPSVSKVNFVDAQQQGLIETSIWGTYSLTNLEFRIASKSDLPLEVVIPVGLALNPLTLPGESNAGAEMAIRSTQVVPLEPKQPSKPVSIAAISINMYNPEPNNANSLLLSRDTVSDVLRQLLNSPDFGMETFRVQQFAVWTILHDPTRESYPYIAEDNAGRIHMWRWSVQQTLPTGWIGAPPGGVELLKVRALMEKVGISPSKYRAIANL